MVKHTAYVKVIKMQCSAICPLGKVQFLNSHNEFLVRVH